MLMMVVKVFSQAIENNPKEKMCEIMYRYNKGLFLKNSLGKIVVLDTSRYKDQNSYKFQICCFRSWNVQRCRYLRMKCYIVMNINISLYADSKFDE